MSSEFIILILGWSLGFASSIISAIVAHRLQILREKQGRGWELEDQNRKRQQDILQSRIAQAEQYVNSLLEFAQKTNELEITMIKGVDKNTKQRILDIDALLTDLDRKAVILYIFKDMDLDKLTDNLHTLLKDEFRELLKITEGHIDTLDKKRINSLHFFKTAREYHAQIIRRLDNIVVSDYYN